MATELLEERLEKMEVAAPEPGRVVAQVLGRSQRRRAGRAPRVAASAVATVVLFALVAYFVPAADTAAGKIPFAGELIRAAGLANVEGRITSVGATTSSSGYRLELVGAYADATRTVLLLRSNPPSMPIFASLTDQFGRNYQMQSGAVDIRTGEATVQFEPLAWPDQFTGARITLRFSSLDTFDADWSPGPSVQGSWTLQATLGVDQATALPVPADATLGPAHFHFISAVYTPATVAVEIEVTGVSAEDLSRVVPVPGEKGGPALELDFIDPSGQIITGTSEASGDLQGTHIRANGFRLGGGGRYVLRVTYAGGGTFERVLQIP